MHVQEVDVVGLEFLQGLGNREVKGLLMVTRVVDGFPLAEFVAAVGRRESGEVVSKLRAIVSRCYSGWSLLGGNDQHVSILPLYHPLPDPLL